MDFPRGPYTGPINWSLQGSDGQQVDPARAAQFMGKARNLATDCFNQLRMSGMSQTRRWLQLADGTTLDVMVIACVPTCPMVSARIVTPVRKRVGETATTKEDFWIPGLFVTTDGKHIFEANKKIIPNGILVEKAGDWSVYKAPEMMEKGTWKFGVTTYGGAVLLLDQEDPSTGDPVRFVCGNGGVKIRSDLTKDADPLHVFVFRGEENEKKTLVDIGQFYQYYGYGSNVPGGVAFAKDGKSVGFGREKWEIGDDGVLDKYSDLGERIDYLIWQKEDRGTSTYSSVFVQDDPSDLLFIDSLVQEYSSYLGEEYLRKNRFSAFFDDFNGKYGSCSRDELIITKVSFDAGIYRTIHDKTSASISTPVYDTWEDVVTCCDYYTCNRLGDSNAEWTFESETNWKVGSNVVDGFLTSAVSTTTVDLCTIVYNTGMDWETIYGVYEDKLTDITPLFKAIGIDVFSDNYFDNFLHALRPYASKGVILPLTPS